MAIHDNNSGFQFERTRYALAKRAVEALAGVCDGAQIRDDRGFDGTDTRAGHLYAFLPLDAWPLCVFHRVWRWTRKYHRQLEAMDIDCLRLPEPPLFEGEERQIALRPQGNGYYVVFPNNAWMLIEAFRCLPGNALHKAPIGANGKLFFRYRTYQGAGNVLLAFAETHRFRLEPGVREAMQSEYRVVYEPVSDSFALYFPDRLLNVEVRTIPCRSCSSRGGFHWIIEARRNVAGPLRGFLSRHGFSVPTAAEQRLQELEREVPRADVC